MAIEFKGPIAHKERPQIPAFGRWLKERMLSRLSGLKPKNAKSRILRFPDVFVLMGSAGLPKAVAWDMLRELRDEGYLEIVAGHGIRLLLKGAEG